MGYVRGEKRKINAYRVSLLAIRNSLLENWRCKFAATEKKLAIVEGGADFSYFSLYFSVMLSRGQKNGKRERGKRVLFTFCSIFLCWSRARKSVASKSGGKRFF